MQKQIIADARADSGFLHFWVRVHLFIYINERMMVGVEVFANGGLQAGRTGAFLTEVFVLALHAVHIGRRTAQVADIALEILHFGHFFHLF